MLHGRQNMEGATFPESVPFQARHLELSEVSLSIHGCFWVPKNLGCYKSQSLHLSQDFSRGVVKIMNGPFSFSFFASLCQSVGAGGCNLACESKQEGAVRIGPGRECFDGQRHS